jgi:hypothetical protein
MHQWWNRSLRVTSRLLNTALLGGYPTETVSGRAWRDDWWVTRWALDNFWRWLGEDNHCYNSWKIDSGHLDRRPSKVEDGDNSAA